MFKRFALGLAVLAASVITAAADFDRWSAEAEDDPFTNGQKVTVSYSTSIRSGIFIFCDSTKDGLRLRAIPGFAYEEVLEDFTPEIVLAIDGVRLGSFTGGTGTVGDNLAAAEAEIAGGPARDFARAFAAAKKQVAIKDGISDRPHLLGARGSTKSGEVLLACMKKQATWPAE